MPDPMTLHERAQVLARTLAAEFYDGLVRHNPLAPIDKEGQRTVFIELVGGVMVSGMEAALLAEREATERRVLSDIESLYTNDMTREISYEHWTVQERRILQKALKWFNRHVEAIRAKAAPST